MDHITVKVSPTRPVNETWNHGWSHRYWDRIEEIKVKHFVNRSGLIKVKLKLNNGYFQSVKQNGKAGANYIVTGAISPNLGPARLPYLANLTK